MADRTPLVPLFDLRIDQSDLDAVAAVLRSGQLVGGELTGQLEAVMESRIGARAIAVSSGTAALHLSYLAAGIGRGDEVVVPAMTFVATASAVRHCGATPVFADIIGIGNPSIDPDRLEEHLTPRTKAVCAVHYGGYAAPVDELSRSCAEWGIALVEDAAHAPGASLQERALGSWGVAGAFSFFSNKVLSAGEGGLVAVADEEVAARVRQLRRGDDSARVNGDPHASDGEPGFDYELDEPRAALLLSRLKRMDAEIARRRGLTLAYRTKLAGLDEVIVPYSDEQVMSSACYVMPIAVRDAARRDAVRARMLQEHGVQTSVLYPAVHELTAYRDPARSPRLPNAEALARAQITLPLYPHMTEGDQDRVVSALTRSLTS